MISATISLTESQVYVALGNFIVQATGLPRTSIVLGQDNRVPQPRADDFVIMTFLGERRLSTNVASFYDDVVEASVAGNQLNVTAVTHAEGPIQPSMRVSDTTGILDPSTVVVSQVSGAPGGVGVYEISPAPQNTSNETMYVGVRADLVPTEANVQVDVYGPRSGNYAKIIEGLFYSEWGTDSFAGSGFAVSPLYISEARQLGFVSGEAQWQERWLMETRLQMDPVIGTPQDFFPEVDVTLVQTGVVQVP